MQQLVGIVFLCSACCGAGKLIQFWYKLKLVAFCTGCSVVNDTIQLVGGDTQGLVEICQDNQWESVCDFLWTNTKAALACRELGLPYTGARGKPYNMKVDRYGCVGLIL